DVLGVEWDPYTADHLQVYKYDGDTRQWLYNEMPLHQPFYDREWIAVVPGPVTIRGTTYPWVSFIKGGYLTKEAWYYSTDGLNYLDISSKVADQIVTDSRRTYLNPTKRAMNDWIQPNTNGGITRSAAVTRWRPRTSPRSTGSGHCSTVTRSAGQPSGTATASSRRV
ncbi:MAG TPA: hypothetical protein VGP51_00565, partial [Nocardioidaceae bacterium]|nr:hypothetical protein [Nocardioidaceae bacterium]